MDDRALQTLVAGELQPKQGDIIVVRRLNKDGPTVEAQKLRLWGWARFDYRLGYFAITFGHVKSRSIYRDPVVQTALRHAHDAGQEFVFVCNDDDEVEFVAFVEGDDA